jgi:hypothetical protein
MICVSDQMNLEEIGKETELIYSQHCLLTNPTQN